MEKRIFGKLTAAQRNDLYLTFYNKLEYDNVIDQEYILEKAFLYNTTTSALEKIISKVEKDYEVNTAKKELVYKLMQENPGWKLRQILIMVKQKFTTNENEVEKLMKHFGSLPK